MQQIILSLFLKAKSVTKTLLFCAVIMVFLNAQDGSMEKAHYDLITKVIAEDTIVQDWQRRILQARVVNGTLEPKDTISFVRKIKTKKLRLYGESLNQSFIKILLENQDQNNNLTRWIGNKINKKTIAEIPLNFQFNKKNFCNGIELINETSKPSSYHRFSNPIEIKSKVFLLYWLKYNGPLNSSYQLIKYTIDSNGNYILLGYYPMSMS